MDNSNKFNPNDFTEGLFEAFQEFVAQFHYSYEALNREPPATAGTTPASRAEWISIDKRRCFLGRFADRNMQKRYEDVTTVEDREKMTFKNMLECFRLEFKLNANTTLANFKFRKLVQLQNESFDLFVIRIKREAEACEFTCASETCTAKTTMIRDQLIIGTREDTIRQKALEEQWDYKNIITKGKSIEAAAKGAAKMKIKVEPRDVYRMNKPGKNS